MKYLWLFDKNKLLILESLLQCEEACGCDIRNSLGIPKNLLSYHIKILRENGFLVEEKCGKRKKYRICKDKIEHVQLVMQVVGMKAPKPPEGGLEQKVDLSESANPKIYATLYEKALEMRNNPTEAEELIWEKLKNKATGYKFRRQHIIDNFIVDFFCFQKGLIVELDGKIHDKQKERDFERTEILKSQGYTVIRFPNKEVIENIDQVINEIKKYLN